MKTRLDKKVVDEEKWKIGRMTHFQMAHLHRFAPAGHPYFVRGTELCELFASRFRELGAWNKDVSKKVGWSP